MANALILMIGISGSGKSTYVQSVLRQSYPDYDRDPAVKKAGLKKKVIYHLLKTGRMEQVLKLYDR